MGGGCDGGGDGGGDGGVGMYRKNKQWWSWHLWRPGREHTKVSPPAPHTHTHSQWMFATFSNQTIVT